MQGDLSTTMLEFSARSAWTRIVPSNLWLRAEEVRRIPKLVLVEESLCFEVMVNLHRSRRCTHNQSFADLRANWIFIRSHIGIGMVFVSQREDRDERAAMV